MKIVLLAAGKGTRMRPFTHERPKCMAPVLDRPMIDHMILAAASAGIDEVIMVIGHQRHVVRDHLGDGGWLGVPVRYVIQEVPDGNGSATLLTEQAVGGEPFVCGYADILTAPHNYQRILDCFGTGDWDAVLTINRVDDPYRGAAIYLECVPGRGRRVARLVEKPPRGTSTTNWNNAGLYVFSPNIFDALRHLPKSPRGEYELSQAVGQMAEETGRVAAVEIEGFWTDVAGLPELLRIQPEMVRFQFGEGAIGIMPGARIADGAELVAPVMIGEGASVGRSVVGPNVCVGRRSVIGDGCTLAHCTFMEDSTIGDRCRLVRVFGETGCVIPSGAAVEAAESQCEFVASAGAAAG
ncbi:MAG: sugar phosphate nucleotidyltransferase [Armatimonadota bacterium]